jgi:hypothetical protein
MVKVCPSLPGKDRPQRGQGGLSRPGQVQGHFAGWQAVPNSAFRTRLPHPAPRAVPPQKRPEGEGEDQTACKPGSVRPLPSRRESVTVIPLDRPLPTGSRDLPGSLGRRRPCLLRDAGSLFGLAPGGACHAAPVTSGPVRSYRTLSPLPCFAEASQGGLLSVALSLGSPPVGVTHRHVVVEPGLSSTPESAATARPSDRRGNWSRRAVRSTTSPWLGRPRPCRPSVARGS